MTMRAKQEQDSPGLIDELMSGVGIAAHEGRVGHGAEILRHVDDGLRIEVAADRGSCEGDHYIYIGRL